MSSPYHSQSNGKSEAAVKIAKGLLRKPKDPMKALLEWRNTPTTGLTTSPVQRLMQRRTRATVPQAERLLKPALQPAHQTMEGKTKTKSALLQPACSRPITDTKGDSSVRPITQEI